MRSSWVHSFFHQATGNGLVLTQPHHRGLAVSPPREKVAGEPAQRAPATGSTAHSRLCLGIGDGTIHRQ
jgi:hypothetical protein